MKGFLQLVFAVAAIGGYYYANGDGELSGDDVDLPEGAIEHVELQNGALTIYEDELVVGDAMGERSMQIGDIVQVKKLGGMLKIDDRNGSYINLSLIHPGQAGDLRDLINELREEQ